MVSGSNDAFSAKQPTTTQDLLSMLACALKLADLKSRRACARSNRALQHLTRWTVPKRTANRSFQTTNVRAGRYEHIGRYPRANYPTRVVPAKVAAAPSHALSAGLGSR